MLLLLLLALPSHAQTNDLPPLSPAYPELPPTFWEQYQSTFIVAGFAFLAFAFLILKTILRPASPKTLPPDVVARQALERLRNEPEDGNTLSAVSQTLRHYISESFDLPNRELTTAEFCSTIATYEQLGTEMAEAISSFLRECDVRKFSPAGGTPPLNAANRALEFVGRIQKANARRVPCPTT